MIAADEPLDAAVCVQRLYAADALPQGGLSYINELGNGMPVAPDIAAYARMVRDCGRRWRVIQGLNRMQAATSDRTKPLADTLQDFAKLVESASAAGPDREAVTISDLVGEIGMERLINGEASNGIVPGFDGLATLLNHRRAGEVSILAARPAWGKTALGLQFAAQVAKAGAKTLIVSKEMTKTELTRRLLAQESQTPQNPKTPS
jgi:replicative DNA helicase